MIRHSLYSLTLLILLTASAAGLLHAQYAEQRWGTEDGLPSNDIFDIAQTPDGFIWLATDNGLARFDGVSFKVFDRTNTPELTRNLVRKLFVASDGTLYIGMSGGGVVSYRDKSFIRELDDFIDEGTYVISFGENEEGLWVGADGSGLFLVAEDSVHTWQEPDIPRNHVFALQRFSGERMAASILVNGLWRFDGLESSPASTPTNELIYDFTPGRGNTLWLATAGQGVFLYEDDAFTNFPMRDYSESSHITTTIKRDSRDRIWTGTAEGIFYTDDEFKTVNAYPGLERSFSLSIMEDQEGNIWIADWGVGLLRLKPATFSNITTADGLPEGATSSVAWYDDTLWIATQFGLYAKKDDGYRVYTSEDGMYSSNPHLLLADSHGRLLVSYFGPGGGVDIFENGTFTRHPLYDSDSNTTVTTLAMYEDTDGSVFFGLNVGLIRWDGENSTLINSEQGLVNNTIRSILRQGDIIWLGTNGGLHGIKDLDSEPDVSFISAPAGTMGSVITALHSDADNNLWIGTFDNGLTLIRNGEFYNFNTSNGLPTDVVWQIVEDEYGYFWMGSTNGITRVNRQQLIDALDTDEPFAEVNHFTRADGLKGTAIYGNHQPTALLHNGKVYFPGSQSLVFADPANIIKNTVAPTAVIEQVLKDLEPYELPEDGIRVSPQVRALEIQYTSPTFTAPSDVRFQYRLTPYDTQWQDVGTRRTAYYTSIPHGRYTFEVKAINENGVESLQPAIIPVRVMPAFWETWWFYSALVLLVFGIAYGGYRYKVHNFKKLNNLRLRISKDLHDEIGSNLASIAIRSSVVKKREHTSPQTAEDLDEIRNLSRLTAESMRDIVWLINPDNDKMENLLIKLREVVSNMLMETEWTFDSNMEDNAFTLQIQKRRTIILIAKEVLHNIVKHAAADKVEVRFHQRDSMLSLSIKDNGKGFDPENLTSSGLGLRSMRERAAEVDGTIGVITAPGKGTTITLDVPV